MIITIKLLMFAAEPADPTAGMSAREKKMYELQQRLRQSRKANENAVIAEKRRQQVRLSVPVHLNGAYRVDPTAKVVVLGSCAVFSCVSPKMGRTNDGYCCCP